jgi:Mn-dependent DtxR family transcriptional regulator
MVDSFLPREGARRGRSSVEILAYLIIRDADIYRQFFPVVVETLQQLTHRQVEALRVIATRQNGPHGASLKDIAAGLRVQSPSALAHLGPLEELGLISRFRGKSRLTSRGFACLEEYRRHHRVAESLFSRAGLSAEATCRAAREVDLALSHRTVEKICAAEGHPEVCPHGAPIAPCHSSNRGS